MTGRLQFAHGLLWRSDSWYRRAWYIAPQVAAVVAAGWLLTSPPSGPAQQAAAPVADWGAAIPQEQLNKAAEQLRDRAMTDPVALRDLQALADTGDPLMEFELGSLYDPTRPPAKLVAPSMKTAAGYYRAAADKGNIPASFNYGAAVIFGVGDLPKDVQAGLPYLFKAAQAGLPAAERITGIVNRDGIGVAKNETWAVQWFRKAADHGDTYSAAAVGAAYWNGAPPYEKDMAQAFPWFLKASADPLNVPPGVILGFYLGAAYREGLGTRPDPALALKWFRQAAERGDTYSATYVASAYWNGMAPYPKDGAQAVQWYLKAAADPANAEAAISLGTAYRDGFGVPSNIPESLKWYRRAAELGKTYAAAEIAFAYLHGTPPYPVDNAAAVKWLMIAAASSDEWAAQRELGISFRDGRGVERNPEKARYWLAQAATNGDASAADLLKQLK
jgi:uncharacterized protein